VTKLLATIAVSAVVLYSATGAADEGIALDAAATEAEQTATLKRIWQAVVCDVVPLESDDSCAANITSWDDKFFRLRAPRSAVNWGVQQPPLQLTGYTRLSYRKPIPPPVDVRIAPGAPLSFAAPKDLCLIDASTRADVSAAVWQPSVACTPLDATRVRLNADLTYDFNGQRLTTPLGVMVAQVFKVGPYEAEVSGARRAPLEPKAYDWTYRPGIKQPFPQ
jgi:hypothetical protein